MHLPDDVVQAISDEWSSVWQAEQAKPGDEKLLREALDTGAGGSSVPMIQPWELREASRKFKVTTFAIADGFHPWHFQLAERRAIRLLGQDMELG